MSAGSPFDRWVEYFRRNDEHHRAIDPDIPWDAPMTMPDADRDAIAGSFQRFALGESGDGAHLLSRASTSVSPSQVEALTLLVAEEQRHSALFAQALGRLGVRPLDGHWSDRAFGLLRRAIGLRTELALFLIAETVATPYFDALADRAPDPVVRAIGQRIAEDEVEHVRFQIDQLRHGLAGAGPVARTTLRVAWSVVATGAALVVSLDHRDALRVCGLAGGPFRKAALRGFRAAAREILAPGDAVGSYRPPSRDRARTTRP